jgi:uncharacterized protein (DUF302 family)
MPAFSNAEPPSDIVTLVTSRSVPDTVTRLEDLVAARGMTVFAIIDHSGAAQQVGLALRDTKLVVFGSPQSGTPVMDAVPLAALDLPLKILIWDDAGHTKISYLDPSALARRLGLTSDLASRLAGIAPLAEALAAP